ncbi:lasso peptide biosynthesis PqqD family chaperone [Streptomyces sp. NPDC046261]|uniref:lasso peptide biosynthesis PqqD family chaperone n=1 Tax=Streptomyces sp. NPDC046261 TaxID=3157200 RepID=UPI0033E1DF56
MYKLAQHVSKVQTDYGVVLLDEVRGVYFTLNPSGVIVLDSVLDSGDLTSAVAALLSEYEVERAVAEEDAAGVLRDLLSAGVVVPSGS